MCKLIVSISFYWLAVITAFADISIANDSSFCIIQEPVLKLFTYNFTSLSDPTKDIIVPIDSKETLRIQLCTPLKQKCNGMDGYGICLITDNQEKGIGKSPPTVEVGNGRTLFIFTGGNCTSTEKYNVTFIMKCDFKAENNSIPELLPHGNPCVYHFLWKTALACGKQIQQNCTVTNNGLHYDLSPLTTYSENYVIRMGNRDSSKIILNVCHSVIFEYNALCQIKSGVCLQKNSSKVEYMNLGDVAQPPFFENGKLKLRYQNGDVCRHTNITTPDIQTTISFICDFEAVDTIPKYIGESEECHYQIIWKTAAACSIESSHNYSAITTDRCRVTNPLTNFTYDLQPLMKKEYYATAQNGFTYTFGVCKSPANMMCASETGICFDKNGTSMGKYNSNLIWQEGGPYLNYTNGDHCENGQHHYTIIAFVCGAEGVSNEPIVMEQKPCQLIIHWNTDLVCEKRIKCFAMDNDEMNLSTLIKSDSNYVVQVNKTEFHINICRPLVPEPSLTCAHGSAVCKATLNSNKEYINEVSLGFPNESPVLDANRDTVLRYTGGSPCPQDPTKLISSNFTFPCNVNSDKGFPEFKEYKDCTYIFEWKTSITCGAAMGTWTSPCIIKDHLSHECDLSSLYKSRPTYYVKSELGKDYNINICGGGMFCNGSAVCQGSKGYGLTAKANVIFDYGRDVIKLQYSNADKCVNTSYTSGVRFTCAKSMGIGVPKLLWESACNAEFEWYTNVTCACKSSPQHLPVSSDLHGDVQMFSLSHASTVATIVLSVIALVAVLFYLRHPDKRTCLRSCWHPYYSRRSSGRVQYCRVDTTEEARLLLDVDPTHCQTDSDDDLLVA